MQSGENAQPCDSYLLTIGNFRTVVAHFVMPVLMFSMFSTFCGTSPNVEFTAGICHHTKPLSLSVF